MSHPSLLSPNIVQHWQDQLGDLLERRDHEDLPLSMLGFYQIVQDDGATDTAGIVAVAANSRECRVFVAVPNDYGMGEFVKVPGATQAYKLMRRGLRANQQIVAVVYARDVTIGGKFALVGTSFLPFDPM